MNNPQIWRFSFKAPKTKDFALPVEPNFKVFWMIFPWKSTATIVKNGGLFTVRFCSAYLRPVLQHCDGRHDPKPRAFLIGLQFERMICSHLCEWILNKHSNWKIPILNRKYIFKWWIFHCYVRLPECTFRCFFMENSAFFPGSFCRWQSCAFLYCRSSKRQHFCIVQALVAFLSDLAVIWPHCPPGVFCVWKCWALIKRKGPNNPRKIRQTKASWWF